MMPPADGTRLAFLAGGGEMGERIRRFDWSATPLGAPGDWPQPLKTLIGLMLGSEQPMFIAWGAGQTWFYNDAFIPIMGAKHPDQLGRHALDEVWREALEVLEPLFARVFDGQPVHMQDFGLMLDRQGRLEEAHFAFSYTPVRDESGRVVGLFGACIEITDRILADRRKDAFLAMLAHELRNPLAPVRHAVRIVRSEAADPAQRDWGLGVIDRQSARMALLLDDLLDISRITHGHLTLRTSRVPLEAILDSAVETVRPLLVARDHVLERTGTTSLVVDADGLRLSQVVSNLLTNAAKYTEPGGHIVLDASREGTILRLSVRDSGAGIDAASLDRVFEMFAQAHGATSRDAGGLGIGLALVKGLVELHGGSVEARSDGPGTGSEFVVTLPGIIVEGATPASLAQPSGEERVAASRRILVADDNVDAGTTLKMLLELDGHDVLLVHDGMQALRALKQDRPEIAVLDIGMPELDGYEVARRCRELGWAVRLVALTGWGQPGDRERAAEAGFDAHLTKPADYDDLRRAIDGQS